MEKLLQAMSRWTEAKMDHDNASAECDYDWGYHGHRYIKELEEAEEAYKDAFRSAVLVVTIETGNH